MTDIQVRVGGIWLRSIGPFADVTMSHVWPYGSEQLTWRMAPTSRFPTLERGGARVEAFVGGVRRWWGKLSEPAADGQYAAKGAWAEASGAYALDGSGNATNTPDTAIDAAIARGALTWTRPSSLSAVAWGTAAEPMRLLELLDQSMAGLGKRWWVDEDGAVRSGNDPTAAAYVVPRVAAGQGLTLAEDDYYSHLVGAYYSAGPVFATVTVGDTNASSRWGYREAQVDLTDMGVITAPTATTQVTNRLALTGARLGFAESLQLGHGQVTTLGGTSVALADLVAATKAGGLMIRLMGITNNSRPAGSTPYTDIVIGRSVYTDGDATATLSPVDLVARNLEEVLVQGAAI